MAETTDRIPASRVARALAPIGASIILATILLLAFGGTAVGPSPSTTPTAPAAARSGAMPSMTLTTGLSGHLTVFVSDPPDGAVEFDAACVTSAGMSFDVRAAATRGSDSAQASLHLPDVALACVVTASTMSGGHAVPFATADFTRN